MIYKLASFLSLVVIYRKLKHPRYGNVQYHNNLQVIEFEDLWSDI